MMKAKIDELRRLIADADYVLIGAGAGLSAAAGLDYAGEVSGVSSASGSTATASPTSTRRRSIPLRRKRNDGPIGPSTSGLHAIGQRPPCFIANFIVW